MSPVRTQLHALEGFSIPPHLREFAEISTSILDSAHTDSLQVDHAVLMTSVGDTYHAYVERTQVEHSLDYEKFAVRLGRESLMVLLDHRHVYEQTPADGHTREYPRSTVVFQNDRATLYRSGIRGLRDEEITENKEVGLEITNHLHHTLGVLGVRYAVGEPLLSTQHVA